MASLIAEYSNYVFVGIFICYIVLNLTTFAVDNQSTHRKIYYIQTLLTILFHACGYVTMFLRSEDPRYFLFFAFQEMIFIAVLLIYLTLYPSFDRQLFNNYLMLLVVGFVILGRLSLPSAFKQFIYLIVIFTVSFFIPWIYRLVKKWSSFGYIFGYGGIAFLAVVWLLGAVTNGSKLSISLFGMNFQPSEFVKITFVLFVAAILSNTKDKYRYLITGLLSFAHVLILVLSKDLGSAGIYIVTYISVVFVANSNILTIVAGALSGIIGLVGAYFAFSHVRVRVNTWIQPWNDMEKSSYQLTQALFAIGTGGIFGMGLMRGTPRSIPYVNEDFIFSAIAEEMGCLFGILLVFFYLMTILQMFRMSIRVRSKFHKLVLSGFASMFAFQVFLTIGGGTRLIPLTGVTLPLISMGGSSLSSTLIMMTIVQAIYIIEFSDYVDANEEDVCSVFDNNYDEALEDDEGDDYSDDEYIEDYIEDINKVDEDCADDTYEEQAETIISDCDDDIDYEQLSENIIKLSENKVCVQPEDDR